MKKITLLTFALLGVFSLSAQTVYFEDDFEDADISDWTLTDVDGDGNNWDAMQVTDQAGTPVSPMSLISRSWMVSALTPDNWAVSPAIDLTGASSATLHWKVAAAAASWDNEHYSVYVGTSDQIAVLTGSTVTFSETYDDPADAGTQYDRSLDLSSLAGEVVYVAFRHHDVTDMDWLSIDDVVVDGTLGIQDNQIVGFEHFYNASTKELNLSANEAISQVNLYNILGQQILSEKLSSTEETINLASLNTGVYLVNVQVEGKFTTFKIVKR